MFQADNGGFSFFAALDKSCWPGERMRSEMVATNAAGRGKAAPGIALKMAALGVALAALASPVLADGIWVITAPSKAGREAKTHSMESQGPDNPRDISEGRNNGFGKHEARISSLIGDWKEPYRERPNAGWIQATEEVELLCEWRPEVFHDFENGEEIVTYSPLPPKLTLLIASSVSGSSQHRVSSTVTTVTPEFENGFGAPTEALPDEVLSPGGTDEAVVKRWKSGSKNLITVGTAGATWDDTRKVWELKVPLKTLKLKLSADVEAIGSNVASVALDVRGDEFNIKEDSRSVTITCPTIETSYFKSTNRTLPAARYRGGVQPAATDAGPFPVSHLRNANGSIDTDSAAEWDEVSKVWYGKGTFRAENTFTVPVVTWELSGGTAQGPGADDIALNRDIVHLVNVDAITAGGINLGGKEDGSDFIDSSKLTATVTDKDDGAVGTNTFTVKWHQPADDYSPDPNKPTEELPVAVSPLPTGAPGDVLQYRDLAAKTDFDIKKAAATGSAIIGVVEGGAAIFVSTATKPWLVVKFIGRVLGMGSAVTSSPPPLPMKIVNPDLTDYEAYKRAVRDTQNGVTNENGLPKFSPSDAVSVQNAIDNFKANPYDDDIWSRKVGLLTVGGEVRFRKYEKYWVADEYDSHGYCGPTPATTKNYSGPLPQITWNYGSGAPAANAAGTTDAGVAGAAIP